MSYYVISIGGTGAKCVESLMHLCAAGLMPSNEELYILAVDPDTANGNLKRASDAVSSYKNIQPLGFGSSQLFKTRVTSSDPFCWSPVDRNSSLDEIFSYENMKSSASAKIYDVLYSEKDRRINLNEGFRGRPSIGAAVMAKKIQFDGGKQSISSDGGSADDIGSQEAWRTLRSKVTQDAKAGHEAKIFLIGSIFGGTGASGFPTIANLLRQTFDSLCRDMKVTIGGVLMLPYFSFTSTGSLYTDEAHALSENFLTNTQAALKYYSFKNTFEDIYNTLYLIGDENLAPVDKFCIGARDQENKAHLVELYASFAAAHFFGSNSRSLDRQYAVIARREESRVQWSDLPHPDAKAKLGQLTRFMFSYLYLVRPILREIPSSPSGAYKAPWFVDYFERPGVNIGDATIQKALEKMDEYANSYLRWVNHVHGQGSGRTIELINHHAIANPANLRHQDYPSVVINDGSRLQINDVWARLCEKKVKDQNAIGLAKFLRALYECCA